jgi:hypothetical protein
MKRRRVFITIDEITLDGIDVRARREIGATLERELRRVFSANPVVPSRSGELARISAPPITLAPAPSAAGLAAGLADRIHRGVIAVGAPRKGRL